MITLENDEIMNSQAWWHKDISISFEGKGKNGLDWWLVHYQNKTVSVSTELMAHKVALAASEILEDLPPYTDHKKVKRKTEKLIGRWIRVTKKVS